MEIKRYLLRGQPPRWIVYATTIFFMIMGAMCYNVWAATMATPAFWPRDVDTLYALKYIDGDSTGANQIGNRGDVQSWDTTWDVGTGQTLIVFKFKYNRADSQFISWAWAYNGLFTPGAGTGDNTVTVYPLDTSGTDALVGNVNVTFINNANDSTVAFAQVPLSGSLPFALQNGTYSIIGVRTGYFFWRDTITVTATIDSQALLGYDYGIDTPGNPDFCNVYGYISNDAGDKLEGAIVTAIRAANLNTTDTSSGIIFSNDPIVDDTDSLGYFSLTLMRTTAFDDTTRGFYDISAIYDGREIVKIRKLYIPAAGNLNLIDSLVNR